MLSGYTCKNCLLIDKCKKEAEILHQIFDPSCRSDNCKRFLLDYKTIPPSEGETVPMTKYLNLQRKYNAVKKELRRWKANSATWIFKSYCNGRYFYICSKCKADSKEKTNYCPNCGRFMMGSNNEQTNDNNEG